MKLAEDLIQDIKNMLLNRKDIDLRLDLDTNDQAVKALEQVISLIDKSRNLLFEQLAEINARKETKHSLSENDRRDIELIVYFDNQLLLMKERIQEEKLRAMSSENYLEAVT